MPNRLLPLFLLILLPAASLWAQIQPTSAPSSYDLPAARAFFLTITGRAAMPAAEKARLETLVADLGAEDWATRDNAEHALKTETAALPFLTKALANPDAEVVTRARRLVTLLSTRDPIDPAAVRAALAVRVAARDASVVEDLVALLESTSPTGRYLAEYNLRRLARQDFGYSSYAEPAVRAAAIQRAQAWWKKNQAGFVLQPPTRQGLLVAASGDQKLVALFDNEGHALWKRTLPYPPSCAVGLPNGNLLVGSEDSPGIAYEYDPAGKLVWSTADLKLTHKSFIMDIARLANGNTVLALPKDFLLVQIDPAGQIPWQVKHLQHPWAAALNSAGDTVVVEQLSGQISELAPDKSVVRAMSGLNTPADVCCLDHGNLLVAEFNARRLLEIDPTGKVVWRCPTKGSPAGVTRLADGTTAYVSGQEGLILVGYDTQNIANPLPALASTHGKVRLVPESFLQAQPKKP